MKGIGIREGFIVIAALILTIVPFHKMVLDGIYSWHIQQPAVVEGGLMLVVFIVLAFLGMCLIKDKVAILLILLGSLYLSLNAVIIPFAVVYLYFEAINYIGSTVVSIKKKDLSSCVTTNFIYGVAAWGAGAILLSFAGHGVFNHLRWLTFILVVVCLLFNHKKKHRLMVITFCDFIKNECTSKVAALMSSVSVFFVLGLAAKSNRAFDFDSVWYGLRPEQVLIGQNSFFDDLGLTSFVYFYPKLMELLFVPVSNLGDYSFIIIANIFVLILIMVAIYKFICFMLSTKQISVSFKLIVVMLIVSMPAIANISATAKPDILGIYFIFATWYFFVSAVYEKRPSQLFLSYLSIFFAASTKPTFLLWGGVLFVFVFLYTVYALRKRQFRFEDVVPFKQISVQIAMVTGVLTLFGIHYRTFLLTGFPYYPVGLRYFGMLGFEPRTPFFFAEWGFITPGLTSPIDMIFRLYQFIFNPMQLGHVIILWTSSFIAMLIIVFALYFNRKKIVFENLLVFCAAFVSLLIAAAYALTMRLPDGNYFAAPLIISQLMLVYYIFNFTESYSLMIKKYIFGFVACLFLALQLTMTLISHPSWVPGTQVFSSDLVRDNFGTRTFVENRQIWGGYRRIADYISANLDFSKIIAENDHMGTQAGTNTMFFINTRAHIETTNDLIPHFINTNFIEDYYSFEQYVKQTNTRAFVLNNNSPSRFRHQIEEFLARNGYSHKVEDTGAVMYILH